MPELLEREGSLKALAGAFDRAAHGTGSTVLVSGEAGIGKTSLVSTFAASLGSQARVLSGGCEALFSPRPLGPLYDIAHELPAPVREMLGQEGKRAELFVAVLAALQAGAKPTVVVIEDIHWADAATLDLVKFLGRRVARDAVLLVLTYRDDELDQRHPLRLVLGDLPSASVTRVPLLPLTGPMVRVLAGRAHRASAELYAVTGGNPFFVNELLQAEGMPETVIDAVLARAARQSSEVRAVLDLAAIVPARIERSIVERVLAPDHGTLAVALASGLLRADGDGLAYRHELSRIAVEQSLPSPRARELHKQVLAALESGGAGSVPYTRLVHHATNAGDTASVLRYAPQAAAQAAAHGAHREAAALYGTAVEHGGELPPTERAGLLERRAYHCYLTDQIEEAIAARLTALEIWRAAGNRGSEGTTLRWLSRLNWFIGNNAVAETYADAAVALLETLPPDLNLAWAYSNRATLDMLAARNESAVEWGERAIELATRLGDDEIVAHALNNVGSAWYNRDNARAHEALERSLKLSLERGYDEHVARAYANLTSGAVTARDYGRAQRYFDESGAYFAARDLDAWSNYEQAWHARFDFEGGRWAQAGEIAAELLSKRRISAISRIPALIVLARLRARRGDSGAEALLEEAAVLAAGTGELQRLAPVAGAQAEAEWLARRELVPTAPLLTAYALARELANARWIGELGYWLWKAGALDAVDPRAEAPYALQIAGRWREAAAAWARIGCPWERALALLEGDEAAQREALGLFEELGATVPASICREQLRLAGARGVSRGPRSSTAANPAGLTMREMEILALVAQGLPNGTIARRLSRSGKTVDHHVSAILAKLEVRTRAEAINAARRLGLIGG